MDFSDTQWVVGEERERERPLLGWFGLKDQTKRSKKKKGGGQVVQTHYHEASQQHNMLVNMVFYRLFGLGKCWKSFNIWITTCVECDSPVPIKF